LVLRIDADSHIFTKDAMEVAKAVGYEPFIDYDGTLRVRTPWGGWRMWGPSYYDLDVRLAAMKAAGFEKQLLICDQGFMPDFVPLEMSQKLCSAYNNSVAKIQKEREEFISIADVPHQDVGAALKEAKRAIEDLGLRAIRVYGTWAGKGLESDAWLPFFELVSEHDVALFFHAHGSKGMGELQPNLVAHERLQEVGTVRTPSDDYKPLFVVGNGFGSCIEALCLVAGLVLHGVLKKYSNLRIALLECGVGWAPWIESRVDWVLDWARVMQSERPAQFGSWLPFVDGGKITTKPSEYVRKHFWWAIDGTHETIIPLLVRELGMGKKLLAQTDFPHQEGSLDVGRWLQELNLPESDINAIMGGNACDILKMG
jgi:predicted TIM-barrel fold metal-dependent hydrolase